MSTKGAAARSSSPALTGSFGPANVGIASLQAGPSSTPRPDTPGAYQNNVTLTLTFDRPTNRGGTPTRGVTKAQIDLLLAFDKNIGSS